MHVVGNNPEITFLNRNAFLNNILIFFKTKIRRISFIDKMNTDVNNGYFKEMIF